MLINACTIIISIICQTLAYYDKEYSPNVGTVLFSNDDVSKQRWSKTDIGLLKARRYFQTLLPPPIFINTFSEDYVNILLRYFKDAYATIKNEAADPETDKIMTTALSDAIGGYLKVWVLPVAKLDYYGGTVSQENVMKLFKFYNEIKRYLDTDGDGWRKPDETVLNSITINVAPLKMLSNTRSNKDACDNLAYFEKTPEGLGVPIPYVNWNEKMSTMFIPLKNVSLVPMNAPDSAQNLIKFYDTARGCILSSNPKDQDKFDEKFQTWLANDVIPHLKDENLYLALGSVLSLVNRTRDIYHNVMDIYSNKYYATNKQPHSIPSIPVDLTSKKMWIISIILLIEIAWCIPALIYILCTKKVNKKDCSSNVYLFIDKPDKRDKGFFFKGKQNTAKSNACSAIVADPRTQCKKPDSPTKCGIKLFRKSRLGNMEFEAQYPSTLATHTTHTIGTGTRSFSSKDQSVSPAKTPSCTEAAFPKKSSLKKISSHNFTSDNSTRILTLSSQEAFNYCEVKRSTTADSIPIIQDSLKTITSIEEKYEPKMKRDRSAKRCCEKDDRKQQEGFPYLEERKKCDERRKYEERKKPEECRRLEERKKAEEFRRLEERRFEERQRAEENRRLEERQRAEENRRLEERLRAEECRRIEEQKKAEEHRRLEERRKAEEARRLEERQRAEECRRLEERQRAEECRRLEERQRAEECRRLEERQRAEECRRLEERIRAEECRRLEEQQKAEEHRRIEERRKAEEARRSEERKKAEELRRIEERKKAEEMRRSEERKKAEEHRKHEERKKAEENRRQEERKKAEEMKKLEERKKQEEGSCCRKIDACCRRDGDCCKTQEDININSDFPLQNSVIEVEKCEFQPDEESEEYDIVSEMITPTPQPCAACEDPICSCTGCMQGVCRKAASVQDTESAKSETDSKMSDKQVETKTTRFQVRKELKTAKAGGVRLGSGKPYLEITIDRPATEICVDVSRSIPKHSSHKQLHGQHTPHNQSHTQAHTQSHTIGHNQSHTQGHSQSHTQSHSQSHAQSQSVARPSKIPKLASCNIVQPMTFDGRRPPSPIRSLSPSEKRKSLIPQRKKKTVDDIVLNPCHCGKSDKLNDTF